jgi:hypothetical protein
MQAPPFRLARTAGARAGESAGQPLRAADACCAGPSSVQLAASRRRTRLTELDSHLHCSIIGTCLTTHELRKLVPRFTELDRQRASDLEIHHAAVELAIAGGAGSKALQKALDERYAGALRRFEQARDEEALLALWNEALKNGDIPPAYWAVSLTTCSSSCASAASRCVLISCKRFCCRSTLSRNAAFSSSSATSRRMSARFAAPTRCDSMCSSPKAAWRTGMVA